MASVGFKGESEAKRPQVQVGDPFMEKLLLEACLELMEGNSIIGVQDFGAAGLTSASAEMAARGGCGMNLELSRVPLREEGMDPYEIALSESQERMLLVVRKGTEGEVEGVFRKWGVDAVVIGEVIGDQDLVLRWKGAVAGRVPVRALVDEAPRYDRPARKPDWQEEIQSLRLEALPDSEDPEAALKTLLSSPNIASKEWVYRQYDHLVQLNTVVPPGSDAALLRVKGTGMGLALTVDGHGRLCYLDPYLGGVHAVAEAARNLACVGAEPIGVSDCLNFGNPEDPSVMWQFVECLRGIGDACRALDIPVVSGNVSFYNETDGHSIFPTPTIAMVGTVADFHHHVPLGFQAAGDLVVLLGGQTLSLGGSEFLSAIHGLTRGRPAEVDLEQERNVLDLCRRGIRQGVLRSAHDVSDGGLAVALAESCLCGAPTADGASVRIPIEARKDLALFGESSGRIVVSVSRSRMEELSGLAQGLGVPVHVLGEVGRERLEIAGLVSVETDRLRGLWSGAFARMMGE
jgi:phosphoribosylformylglycinamidine synthase